MVSSIGFFNGESCTRAGSSICVRYRENHNIERTASSHSQMYYERTYCTISHVVKNMAVECILHMRENALFWLRSLKMKIDTKYLPFGS